MRHLRAIPGHGSPIPPLTAIPKALCAPESPELPQKCNTVIS
jgi:hypothetical protein